MTTNVAQQYKAVVIGATGAVGTNVVKELVHSPRCAGVTVLGRRTVDPNTWLRSDVANSSSLLSKITQHQVDMDRLEEEAAKAIPDGTTVAFCTLGVGQPSKVTQEVLWKVDVEYAKAFAKACKQRGVKHISLLGAVGTTTEDSWMFYMRAKAAAEAALIEQKFERASMFRPSLLRTKEIRYGLQDSITQWLFPKIQVVLPYKYYGIWVEDLAKAMRVNAEIPSAKEGPEVVEIYEYLDFVRLANSDPNPKQ